MNYKYFFKIGIAIVSLVASLQIVAQTGAPDGSVPFIKRYEIIQKGEKIVIGNGVIGPTSNPNGNYNGGANNGEFEMSYADIDNNSNTFSSTSAEYLDLGNRTCSVVTKAYLYWSGTYTLPGDPPADQYPIVDPRADFRNVKLKVPGGNYVDINPTSGTYATQTIFNGYRNTLTNPLNLPIKNAPYVCVADVTELILPLTNLNGDYTVANVRTYEGNFERFADPAAGWILVFITENPLQTRKYMAVYDGYTSVQRNNNSVDYTIDGFSTIPAGPVNARYAVGAVEGDRGLTGDNLRIRTNLSPGFSTLSNGVNPQTNFFNSTISLDGNHVSNRNPASTNTIGFDSDVFRINNPLNTVIPNNETGATFRVGTNGDAFGVFMNAFEIEVIEPEVFVTKRVYDTSNTDITGGGVLLGQELFYELNVQNIGNDNAINAFILDDLPINVDYLPGFGSFPTQVSVTYDAALRQVRFDIDPTLLQVDDAAFTIRFKVKVVTDCSELRDACSNIIANIATSFYQGEINTSIVGNSPSYYDIDGCNFGIAGTTNFLIDTDNCDFTRNEVICGNSLDITAGSGYTSYQWTDSLGTIVGNTQTITVSSPGTYQVFKTAPAPCVSDIETVIVDFFNNLTNPLLSLADNVQTCTVDGSPLPEFFLCGINDTRQIITGVQDAQSISWQQLDPTSCAAQTNVTCPNDNVNCIWNEVATGSNFDIVSAGSYRVRFDFPNGCFRTFYFNAYQNTLNPSLIVLNPIVCGNPGSIEVQNIPSSGYEFSLSPSGPFQSSPTFTGLSIPNNYTVFIRQNNGLSTACLYDASTVLSSFDFDFDVIKNDIECSGDKGSITMRVTNGLPNYEFNISNAATGLNLTHNSSQSTHTFDNLDSGTYDILITGFNGLCMYSEIITIDELPPLDLNLILENNITCLDGLIRLIASGGTTNYNFAISSVNGTIIQPSNYVFQSNDDFIFVPGEEGDYEFIVVDQNNCSFTAGPISIRLIPPPNFNPILTDTSCSGNSDGTIDFNITSTLTGSVMYSVDGGLTFQSSSTFNGLSSGVYDLVLRNTINAVSCDQSLQVSINNQPVINADVRLLSNLGCNTPAQIEVFNVTGGAGNYVYSIDGTNYVATTIFSAAFSGNYTVYVQDSNGCVFQANQIVVNPVSPVTDISVSASLLTCPNETSDLTINVVGGVAPYVYQIIAPSLVNNGNSNVFLNIPPDSYTIRVTDDRNCVYEETYTLSPLPILSINVQVVSDVTCVGDTDGEVNLLAGNFTSTYSYNLTGAINISNTNQTINSQNFVLPAGTYLYSITDETTNCETATTIIINEPSAALQIDTLDVTDLLCSASGVSDGSLIVNATGGWGSNRYRLTQPDGTTIGPQTSSNFIGLSQSGGYLVEVTDINGCIVDQSFNLTPATSPILDLTLNNVCFSSGSPTSLIVNISSGGTAPFQFQLDSGAFQNTNVFNNLLPGSYTINVIDSKGCTSSDSITINQELLGNAFLVKGLDCSANPDAEIDLTVSGGVPSYTYEVSVNSTPYVSYINGFPYSTSSAGDYLFRITDNLGCIVVTRVVTIAPITNPDIISVTQTQDILCNGDSTGAFDIQLDQALGSFPVSYEVNGIPYGNQNTISGLAAGIYNIIVTDSNGCQDTETFIINQPGILDFSVSKVDITCNTTSGLNLGQISVENVSGGVDEFTYYLSNNFGYNDQYTTTASGEDHTFPIVDFGIYTIVVEDSNGCVSTVDNIVIASPPDDLLIDVSSLTPDCSTGASVIVTASSPLGSGMYEFAFLEFNTSPYSNNYITPNNGLDSHIFTGLIPGAIYTFVVRDLTTNCFFLETSEFPTATFSSLTNTISPNDVTCIGSSDGSVSFTFDGYDSTATSVSYELYNSSTTTSIGIGGVSNVNPPSGPVAVDNLGLLMTGTYFIVFTEVGGNNDQCVSASAVFTIEESVRLLEVTASSPANDNCNSNAGLVTVQAAFGSGGYQYIILPDTDPAPDATSTLWGVFSSFNVNAGNYLVYVRDDRNCIVSAPVSVLSDPIIDIVGNVVDDCVSENSFELELNFLNTTDIGVPSYSLSVDSAPYINISGLPYTVSSLSSGSHTFTLRDSNNCTDTQTVIINAPLQLSAQVIIQPSCSTGDGIIEVIAQGGTSNYDIQLWDSVLNPTGQVISAGNQFVGLNAGDYFIELTDVTTNCSIQIPIQLETPENPILLPSTIINVSCNGLSNGEIVLNLDPLTVSNPVYSYTLINEVTGLILQGPQSSPIFTNLSAGDYRGRVRSGRNCIDETVVSITQPAVLEASATLVDFVCNSNNSVSTAEITVQVENDIFGIPSGTAPYLYSMDGLNYQSSPVFDILDTGSQQNITIITVDANNCSTSQTIVVDTLEALLGISFNLQTSLTCSNPEQVEVLILGGSGTYDFNLLPNGPSFSNVNSNSSTFNLPIAGDYVFEIIDVITGCEIISAPYTVVPVQDATVTALFVRDVDCINSSTGSLDFNVTDYNGNYDYNILDQNGTVLQTGTGNTANTQIINNLPAGIFTVEIMEIDSPFCSYDSNAIQINQPIVALSLDLDITNLLSCNPGNDAQITATASGGWVDYTYSMDGIVFSTADTFSGLGAGTYEIYVRDRNLNYCETSSTIVIDPPLPITASIIATTLVCNGDTSAEILVTAAGGQGVGTYFYSLIYGSGTVSTAQQDNVFRNLPSGTYSVIVSDNLDCSFTTASMTIIDPTVVTATSTISQDITCTSNASVTVTASNGTAPYEYSSDGQSFTFNNVFINLIPGTYSFFVRDSNGCISNVSNGVTVEAIVPLSATQDLTNAVVNCDGDSDATVSVQAIGGLGNYSYELFNDLNVLIDGPQPSGYFNTIGSGNYYIVVTSADCVEQLPQFIVNAPNPIIASIVVQDVSCFGEVDGRITINASGGAGSFIYSLDQLNYRTINDYENLAVGTYDVFVQDANGCYQQFTATIVEPDRLVSLPTIVSEEICLGDGFNDVSIAITGGSLPYRITYDNVIFENVTGNSYTYSGLDTGLYSFTILDANDCLTATAVIEFTPPIEIVGSYEVRYDCDGGNRLEIVDTNPSLQGDLLFLLDSQAAQSSSVFENVSPGIHQVEVIETRNGCSLILDNVIIEQFAILSGLRVTETGLNTYDVDWTGGEPNFEVFVNGMSIDDATFMITQTGSYTISVRDSRGCEVFMEVSIAFIDLEIPNLLTPNGDGDNDTWQPDNISLYPNAVISIFDRYGRELQRGLGVNINWDGTYQGINLPSGDYWYAIELKDLESRVFKGNFTLYR
jgi:gliding motility-associated-like protein/uncharacterized repeat protein (TIGR01451 family)